MENDTRPPLKPLTVKRKKILEMAFAQLRKARAKIDPSILKKIRRMIAGSPEVMKGLGINEQLKPVPDKAQIEDKIDISVDEISRASRREKIKEQLAAKAPKKPKKKPAKRAVQSVDDDRYEKVDQAKNMEILAKLMSLHPKGRDMVKSAIKKASE